MKHLTLVAITLAVILPFTARAQGKTDFSGTWTLNAEKSDTPPQRGGGGGGRGFGMGGGGPVTIKQTATTLTIESQGRGGPMTLTYHLDGSESSNEMPGRGGPVTAKSKAHWDGSKLVIETTRDMGGNSVTTTETRSLSADGKEMTVETSFNGNSRKTVFVKG
jgi:hypothetical protein